MEMKQMVAGAQGRPQEMDHGAKMAKMADMMTQMRAMMDEMIAMMQGGDQAQAGFESVDKY